LRNSEEILFRTGDRRPKEKRALDGVEGRGGIEGL
jgi:hypothetical protein